MNPTDAELMQRVHEGDHEAFWPILGRYNDRVMTYIAGFLRSDDRAADVAQETFLRLFRHALRDPRLIAEDETIEPLLFAMAARATIDEIRREEANRRLLADAATVPVDQPPQANAAVMTREIEKEVHAALGKLPPELWQAILLHFFEERSFSEVASLTDCSENAVRKRITRGRKLLISHLERYWKGEDHELRTASERRTGPSSETSPSRLR